MQAIKSLFSKKQTNQIPDSESHFDHSKLDSGQDISQCPFMKNKTQDQVKSQASKCPHPEGQKAAQKKKNNKKPKETGQQLDSSSDEDEVPRGGCPFMGGSQKKRNPDLLQSNSGFDEPFVSKFSYYLSANKIDFGALKRKKNCAPISKTREVFNKYPIYLQHSLFFNGEDYQKVRSIECCSRFLPYEKLREKGNKLFNKQKYTEALDYYERSLSLFKWLEYYEEQDMSSNNFKSQSLSVIQSQQSIESLDESQQGSKIHMNLGNESEEEIEEINAHENQFDEMKDKYKEFFVVYNDSNVRLCDGQDMQESADIDMRKSLLLQVYLNMSVCYAQLNNFTVALQCIEDCFGLSEKVSQIYFRKAQIILMNKASSVDDLEEAKRLMEKALLLKSTEKIFESNQNILKMVNLHNADEVYKGTLKMIEQKLIEKKEEMQAVEERIYNRVKQIHEVEKRLIEQGKTPYERSQEPMEDSKEFQILERMRRKYIKVIQFYTEAQNAQQVRLAKLELQELLKVFSEMFLITSCKITEKDNQLGGINTEKIQRRIITIKKNFCEDIYNAGKFNFTVLEWAIKEILKQERQQEELRAKAEKEERERNGQASDDQQVVKQGKMGDILKKASWGLVLLPVVGIIINSFLI